MPIDKWNGNIRYPFFFRSSHRFFEFHIKRSSGMVHRHSCTDILAALSLFISSFFIGGLFPLLSMAFHPATDG